MEDIGEAGYESLVVATAAVVLPSALAAFITMGCGKKREPPVRKGRHKSERSLGSSAKSKRTRKSGSGSNKARKKTRTSGSSSSKSKSSRSKSKSKSKSIDKSDKSRSKRSSKSKRKPRSTQDAKSDRISKQLATERKSAAKASKAAENSLKVTSQTTQKSDKPAPELASARDLIMEPSELRWSTCGGLQKVALVNQTNDRQAVKVKCSDNNVYRVNPVFAFIEPGQTLNVDVMRQNGSAKVDKLVFVTIKASPDDTNPRSLFKDGRQSSLMVLALLANGGPPIGALSAQTACPVAC